MVAVARVTVTVFPTAGLAVVFAHAAGTLGVAFPIDAPCGGPGYDVTLDGVQAVVTGATSKRSAVQVDAKTSNRVSFADAMVAFELSSPVPGNWRKETALSGPALGEPTLMSASIEWSPGEVDSA